MQLANLVGKTFGGLRDIYKALGYDRELTIEKYRERFDRDPIAGAIVSRLPEATWRGGGELIEDEDPDVLTQFEEEFFNLSERINFWSRCLQVDTLAGLGEYAILLMGAPGKFNLPLTDFKSPDDLLYLGPYSQDEAEIIDYDTDKQSPRFGKPLMYKIDRKTPITKKSGVRSVGPTGQFELHWSRAIHVADGCLNDDVFGAPRLKRPWNRLDDLDKVVGGGSESFWLRAHQGFQFDIDKEMELDPEDEKELEDEITKYIHGIERTIKTRGMSVKPLGSDVANYQGPADVILTLIAGGIGIPKRILVGSERGDLASTQDRSNWSDRVNDRRRQFAGPWVVRQLVDRLIKHKALPTPATYDIRWMEIRDLNAMERSIVASRWAGLNDHFKDGKPVVTQNELRDQLLGLVPRDDLATDQPPLPTDQPPEDQPPEDQPQVQKSIKKLVEAKRRQPKK